MKKKTFLIFTFIHILLLPLFPEMDGGRETLWKTIEQNNLTLKTMRAELKSCYYETHSGISMKDPQVNLSYLWNGIEEGSDKRTLSVEQEFDLSLGRKKKVADGTFNLMCTKYAKEAAELRKQTYLMVDKYVMLTKRIDYRRMLEKNVEQVCHLYEKAFKMGECSKLDLNRIQMSYFKVQSDCRKDLSELCEVVVGLMEMNGGIVTDTANVSYAYDVRKLPQNFDVWYSEYAAFEPGALEMDEKKSLAYNQEQLAKSAWWPKFSVGYDSEIGTDEKLRGMSFGLSLPLWENRNVRKAASANRTSSTLEYEETQKLLYTKYHDLYELTKMLLWSYEKQQESVQGVEESEALLQKAVRAGEISLGEYLMEITVFSEVRLEMIQSEYEYESSKTELLMIEQASPSFGELRLVP